MSHKYYCEQLDGPGNRLREEVVINKARPLATSGPYLNATIKGRKLA